MPKLICPQCNGLGVIYISGFCELCNATGKITRKQKQDFWKIRGLIMKEWRKNQGYTLEDVRKKYGIDPGNLSRMERGLSNPKRYW